MPDHPQSTLLRLLDLQAEDTAIKRLQERRASLPEAAELERVQERLREVTADLDMATKNDAEISRRYSKLEGEIDLLSQKIDKDEKRAFSGSVGSPKELSALQASIDQEKRQRSTLEDQLLEVMEEKERSTETLERTQALKEELTASVATLDATLSVLTGDIDAELGEHEVAREKIVPEIPDDLLALYERLREAKGGVGAAPLVAGNCEGCHTKLPQREWERIRAELGLQRCENCRRIVVVTDA